KEWKYA
ncbi:hypothetical protein D047_1806B, partial [Vibrio parahaemolyticus VPTS-2010_2]